MPPGTGGRETFERQRIYTSIMFYLVAHMITPMTADEKAPPLPLHMTLVHWFETNIPQTQLQKAVASSIETKAPVTVQIGPEALFGLSKDIRVNRVNRNNSIMHLHETLLDALKKHHVRHTNPQWTRAGWNPHVTHQPTGRLYEGDSFTVDSVSLICSNDYIAGKRLLLATYPLNSK